MNLDIKELKALISLLDDSDDEIVNIASSNLMNQGLSAIPELEKAWETTLNETLQERLESVIQNIQFNEDGYQIHLRVLGSSNVYVLPVHHVRYA